MDDKPEDVNQTTMTSSPSPNVEQKNEYAGNARSAALTEPSSTFTLNSARETKKKIKQSRIAAVQGCLYSTSALFTAVWVFLPWVGFKLKVETPTRFFFAFMLNSMATSQGTFNLYIFTRVQYIRLRETNKDWSRWKCIKQCLFSAA